MARHARLASHVFPSFTEFMDWIVIQQFDISSKPERAPILKAGQRVVIKDVKSVYVATRHIETAADILVSNPKGGFHPRLIEGQDFLFLVEKPRKTRVEINPSGDVKSTTLRLDEVYTTQNSLITIGFDRQDENFNRFSSIHVLGEGGVTLNTGVFNADLWSGSGNSRHKPGRDIPLLKNSSYLVILMNENLVHIVETGRSAFELSQKIPSNPLEASSTLGASEKAVSEGLFELNAELTEAIAASAGFLKYAGIDPATNLVTESTDEFTVTDIGYAADIESELAIPNRRDMYALLLNDANSVKVLKSVVVIEPSYVVNAKYLGEGNFGLTGVSAEIKKAYPSAKDNDIVSNLDTGTEWELSGLSWYETIRPAKESEYAFSPEYIGVYNFRKSPSIMGKAIGMTFPIAPIGGVVVNTTTNTEWKKSGSGWQDTGMPPGTTDTVPNPVVSGTFMWDSSNPLMVGPTLSFVMEDIAYDGLIIYVFGGNEWMYVGGDQSGWIDTGKPGGTSAEIPNHQYIGEGSYGVGIAAANAIIIAYPDAVENDYVGNTDSDTDWKFDGEAWVDTGDSLGLNRIKPNVDYGGVYEFNAANANEVAAAIKGAFPGAPLGNIVYNNETFSEWAVGRDGEWVNTYSPNFTTPKLAKDPMLLGNFNYLDYWVPPAETLRLVFPEARYSSFVCNTSTGTEWDLSGAALAWVDSGRPIGHSPTAGNPKYLGTAAYKTNPPTDEFIIPLAFPNVTENQFITNITTDTYWEMVRGRWINTRSKTKIKWLPDQVGVYEWKHMGISGIKAGYMFHLTTRNPETDKSEVFWFANSWNLLDFEARSTDGFTNETPGVILGKETFGYVTSELDVDGNSVGRVSGLTSEGDGANFLNDAGNYVEVATIKTIKEDTDIYLDYQNGDDLDTGLSKDNAWKTSNKVQLYLSSIRPIYKYVPGSGKLPVRVTLHIVGDGTAQDLTIEGTPYLTIVGNNSATPTGRRLHVVNSTVVVKDLFLQEKVIVWKSKMQIAGPITCQGIELTDSEVEHLAKVTVLTAESTVPIISIDDTSTFYHGSVLASRAPLAAAVPFLRINGTYIKSNAGSFEKPIVGLLRGIKVAIGPLGTIVGTTLDWLHSSIPYSGFSPANFATPATVNAVRTLYGTDNLTGYQLADGRDLADLIRNAGGLLVRSTYNEAITTIPVKDRYLGMMVYIQQLKGLYHFRDGIFDKDLVSYIVPHYNITKVVHQCCIDEWANQFPFQFVDDDDNLVGEDLTLKDPVQSYILSDTLDWNTHVNPGSFYIRSVANQSIGAPNNVTAWWWLDVGTHMYNKTQLKVAQWAKRHDTTGNVLTRILENGVWGSWTYNYAQYSG